MRNLFFDLYIWGTKFLLPIKFKSYTKVSFSRKQIILRNLLVNLVLVVIVIIVTLIRFFLYNYHYFILNNNANLTNKLYLFNLIKVSFTLLSVIFFIESLWLLVNSKYSPNKKLRLMCLLKSFTEEADLLSRHDNEINLTKSVLWSLVIKKGKYYIELRPGGHLTITGEDDISRRLISFLIKETRDDWYLEDTRIRPGVISIILSHESDSRLIIDNIDILAKSNLLNIKLTKKLFWDIRQPMGMIVGGTGTGKTSLIKVLILSFLANNPLDNKIYTIDGKGSFLSISMKGIGPVATNAGEALDIISDLDHIMNQRYQRMNDLKDNIKDVTFNELFEEGNILLIADELLSLITNIQAEDKQLKASEKVYPKFYAKLLNLIVKGRQASIFVILSGQMIPASILPSEARDSLGLRIALGRVTQVQASEVFNRSLSELPRVDTSNYGGIIWLDGIDLERPIEFKTPFYDEKALPFKSTLNKLISDNHETKAQKIVAK